MNVLCIGDVCGSIGCGQLASRLHLLKKRYSVDFTVVNGENSADGNGITPDSAHRILNIGADVITGGNHSFRHREMLEFYEHNSCVLRPHNVNITPFGSGYCLVDLGKVQVAVINLAGTVYLEKLNASNPFNAADELVLLARRDGADIIIVDFHAEATSEKRALGIYLDGRVSAFYGTHTHVQTADAQILPGGTAYITDIGMTGPKQSVLGVKSDIIIDRLKNGGRGSFMLDDGDCMINGCLFEIDEKTGLAKSAVNIWDE